MSSQGNLERIPDEIHREIFGLLEYRDLLNVIKVSKRWHRITSQMKSHEITFVFDLTNSNNSFYSKFVDISPALFPISNEIERKVKFGIVGYTDHDIYDLSVNPIILVKPLSSNGIPALNKEIQTYGDDHPEALLDGLNQALKMSWTYNANKHIILVCDAPGHGERFKGLRDNFPDGCPCGLDEVTILNLMQKLGINFWFIATGDYLYLEPTFTIFTALMPAMRIRKVYSKNFISTLIEIIGNIVGRKEKN